MEGSETDDEYGLEREQDDPQQTEIKRPFDPEKIKIRTVNIVVGQLISRIKHDEIDLAPDFQRLRGIWNPARKGRLIESLLLRIPIPVFYVSADYNENWAVVDGVQRISTMYDYVTGEFALSRLEYLAWLNGQRHDELPRSMQRRISETQLIVNIIDPGTPEEVMFNIFHRINTGGMMLNGQEIRHALNPGLIRKYLEDLAKTEEFLAATAHSIQRARMSDRECVLRFLAFHIAPWEEYTANDLDGYLVSAMRKINQMNPQQRDALTADFKKAMRAAVDIFGDDAFRKRTSPGDRRKPINRALFEAWSVGLARCSPEQIKILVDQREIVRQQFISLMHDDWKFDTSISYSTGDRLRVQKRFQAIETLIEEFL